MDPLMYGITPYGSMMNTDMMMAPFLNGYQSQVEALDSYNRLNSDALSMDGSIFPNFTGSFDYDQFYKNMQKNQDYMYQNQRRMAENWRSNDFAINVPMQEVQEMCENLHTKIIQDEQEQIRDSYNALKHAVRAAFDPNGEATEKQIAAKTRSIYKQYMGKDLTEDILNHSSGSFKQGFLQTVTLGLYDGVSAEENVAMITGQPVGRKQNALKKTGNALGGATIGAVGLALLSKVKWIAPLFKSKPLWAAIAGAIGGAIAAPAVSQMKS